MMMNNLPKIDIIFMGTADFAVPFLKKLIESKQINLIAVFTQPDRKVGRKQEIKINEIKKIALAQKITVYQPNTKEELETITKDLSYHFGVVIAYGMILTKKTLSHAQIANLNVHGSLLPNYRGASPIQAALLNGETETGNTIIEIDEKLDHGKIAYQSKIQISQEDNYTTLSEKLAKYDQNILTKIMTDYVEGKIKLKEQNHQKATFCQKIKKEDGLINFKVDTAENIFNKKRAYTPWPETYFELNGKKVKLKEIKISSKKLEAEHFFFENKTLFVGCKKGSLELEKLQMQGKNEVSGADFFNGYQSQLN